MMPARRSGKAQPGLKDDGTALGKTREHEPFAREAALVLALNQSLQQPCTVANTLNVLLYTRAQRSDVVPRPHRHAAVQGHRSDRRMGKDETHILQAQLRHDRLEVVPVGTQAVQPDDGSTRLGARFDDDAIKFAHGAAPRNGPKAESD